MSRNTRSVDMDSSLVPAVGAAAEALTVSSSVVTLAALHENTKKVFWTNDGGNIRVTFDGTDPTTNIGHYVADGSTGSWSRRVAESAKFIRISTDALFYMSQMSY